MEMLFGRKKIIKIFLITSNILWEHNTHAHVQERVKTIAAENTLNTTFRPKAWLYRVCA